MKTGFDPIVVRTVSDFFDMVFYNEYHNIRIKSKDTDKELCYFEDYKGMIKSGHENSEIKGFATDWEERIYILWV